MGTILIPKPVGFQRGIIHGDKITKNRVNLGPPQEDYFVLIWSSGLQKCVIYDGKQTYTEIRLNKVAPKWGWIKLTQMELRESNGVFMGALYTCDPQDTQSLNRFGSQDQY